jgi:alkanesulfonate monooxygenase SsuD/methylene tetrahydromethanopterin reductase-like flavin-dependent oxidoreductase (luciferase family)
MMAMDPYPGYDGKYFSMPCRNVLPKPVQKPHPPMWVACSNRDTIHLAAKLGLGALTFAFVDPDEAKKWVSDYYDIIKSDQCTPIGHTVNANIAMVTGFSCHEDEAEARRRGEDGFRFFGYGLGHHYIFGSHKPGRTNIWENFEKARPLLPPAGESRGIGTPDQLREHLASFEEVGVDQVIFIQQGGRNRHEHICESLELFADRVMPDFKARDAKFVEKKQSELSEFVEQALARKTWMRALEDDEIPVMEALGRQVVAEGELDEKGAAAAAGASSISIPLTDPAAGK